MALCAACGNAPGDSDVEPGSALTKPAAVNRAPSIVAPAHGNARADVPFTFRPTVTDADGDSLRFTAQNLPPWMSIDAATGILAGTPAMADAGIYEDITIVVEDAAHSTRSAAFAITVTGDVAAGTASLRWELPPSRVDGAPLDDLAGYRILFGRDSENMDRSVLIDDPAVTSYEFTGLPSGIWYFAVVAVNAGGLEGPPTTVMMKSI